MSSNQPSISQNVTAIPASDSVVSKALVSAGGDVTPVCNVHAAPAANHSGVCEVGAHQTPSFIARVDTPHAESGVSIGPLIAGISMMVLMRRHRF